MEHAPVMHDLFDSFSAVGTVLDRYRVSPRYLCDFGAIRHQYHGCFVNLSRYLQPHAQIDWPANAAWIRSWKNVRQRNLGARRTGRCIRVLIRAAKMEIPA